MKITNLGVGSTALPSQPQVGEASSVGSDSSASGTTASANAYTPSPEFQHLLSLVQQEPQVREDRVQAALQRLQQGYYQTPASAGQTAEAMLNSAW